MKIALTSETTIDLTKELIEKFDIKIVPFSITLGDETYDDGSFPNQKIFDYVKNTKKLPKTSAVNELRYDEFFRNILNEYDEIIHIAFSSELSSACNNAINASQELNGKVHVIDSKSLSTGIALLAVYARELINQNLPIEEIVKKVTDRVPNVQASFVLQNVDYLYKGGRCSKIAFLGANIFHICPQIFVKDGKMDSGKKYRGKYFDVVSKYVDDTLEQFNNPDLNTVFITYPSLDDEENIVNMIKEKLIKRGFKNIYPTYAGSTICSHCGPNTIGILYFND